MVDLIKLLLETVQAAFGSLGAGLAAISIFVMGLGVVAVAWRHGWPKLFDRSTPSRDDG